MQAGSKSVSATAAKPKASHARTREEVLQATLRCLDRFGVARTRMVDIANEAGMSRQTVYRLFATREQILECIATERIVRMATQLQARFAAYKNLREALVEGSMASMEMGQKDSLVTEIFVQGGNHTIDQFIFSGSEEIRQQMLQLWSPLLDRARESGELRPDISNAEAVEWIRNIHGMFTIRDDYDETTQRAVLKKFLIPSLCR